MHVLGFYEYNKILWPKYDSFYFNLDEKSALKKAIYV